MGESQGEQETHLGKKKRGIPAGAWRGGGELHSDERQVPRRRGRASKENLPRRSRRKHERVSGRKCSPGGSGVLVLLQVLPNLKWEKTLGEERPAHKMTKQNELE